MQISLLRIELLSHDPFEVILRDMLLTAEEPLHSRKQMESRGFQVQSVCGLMDISKVPSRIFETTQEGKLPPEIEPELGTFSFSSIGIREEMHCVENPQ
ncbi:hypothetical protein HNY73_012994 [Argiope bruennichi]|uniref:Uncharacterized protein n=1 Tax=Argiope bruennichi TaxID=94029 RepID=A0A8T0F185_ARGBR|nr:hypothetical protein HNY73_012994 [Argiope bruennichi]